MSFKKMLGLILVVVIFLFGLMLTTSYAWYSYEKGSTKFDVVTANDNVEVFFQKGEYINTVDAVPIKMNEIDLYSDKYDFNIRVRKNVVGNEMVAKVRLVDIVIDNELRKIDEVLGDSPFRVQFFYQGKEVGSTITGKDFSTNTYEIGDIVLSNEMVNQFELRVYLLDNGGNQLNLMNKKFQAKIDIDVISRANLNFTSFDNADLVIDKITIDGEDKNSLPVSGLYEMTSSCEKGSVLSYDSLSRTITYEKGSFIGDNCSLNFVSSHRIFYLKDVPVGSYVAYSGNLGCSGNSCLGENIHYVDENNMGYCADENYHFIANGFRVMYIKDDSVHLVSAGALECVNQGNLNLNDFNKKLQELARKYCNPEYVFGNICDKNSVWSLRSSDFELVKDDYYRNDLINIGSYYWKSDLEGIISYWNPTTYSFESEKNNSYGIRPVIKLNSKIKVVGGTGTSHDPYIISK